MANLAQMKEALIAADAAGLKDDALFLAQQIDKARSDGIKAQSAQVMQGAVQDPKTGGYAMPSLVSDQGIGQTIMSGAGRTLDKWSAGALQMLGIGDQKELKQGQKFKDAAYKPLSNARPFSAGFGEGLPAAVATAPFVGPASGLLGGGMAGITAAGTLLGAAPEALKYGTPGERAKGAAWGGLAGGVGALGGAALSKAFAPSVRVTSNALAKQKPGAMDDALLAAKGVGYKPTAGEVTDSSLLRRYENMLRQKPGIAGQMDELASANQRAINRSAAKAVGLDTDNLSESALKTAYDTVKADYGRIINATTPDLHTTEFGKAILEIDLINKELGKSSPAALKSLLGEATDIYNRGTLTGRAYATIRTEFADKAAEAFKNNSSTVGNAYKSLQSVMDDAAEASLPAANKGQFAEVLRRYGDVKTLLKGQVVHSGNVSPARTASALRTWDTNSFKTGTSKSELMDIARIGESFKPYANPTSGGMNADAVLSPEGLIGTAKNRIMGGAYMSPAVQKYLMTAQVPDEVRRAIALSGASAGIAGGSPLAALASNYFYGGKQANR